MRLSTDHGNEVQQVHPRLVGFGVGQGEEGGQLEPHGVSCVAALRIREEHVRDLTDTDENERTGLVRLWSGYMPRGIRPK